MMETWTTEPDGRRHRSWLRLGMRVRLIDRPEWNGQLPLGSLGTVVELIHPGTTGELWQVRMDQPMPVGAGADAHLLHFDHNCDRCLQQVGCGQRESPAASREIAEDGPRQVVRGVGNE
jgi:hypothetical protein